MTEFSFEHSLWSGKSAWGKAENLAMAGEKEKPKGPKSKYLQAKLTIDHLNYRLAGRREHQDKRIREAETQYGSRMTY